MVHILSDILLIIFLKKIVLFIGIELQRDLRTWDTTHHNFSLTIYSSFNYFNQIIIFQTHDLKTTRDRRDIFFKLNIGY